MGLRLGLMCTPSPPPSSDEAVHANSSRTTSTRRRWHCGTDGSSDIFPHLDLDKVQVVALENTYRVFRIVQPMGPHRPDHVLTWREELGDGIVVWSTYTSRSIQPRSNYHRRIRVIMPTAARINLGARVRVAEHLREAVRSPSPRLREQGYLSVRQVRSELRETVWHIVRPGWVLRSNEEPGAA